MKTQRGGQLRRQGAFYDTPDWGTMTVISSAVPDTPPPSSPASSHTQEEVTSTTGKSRADVRALVEVEHGLKAAAADNRWKAPQHYMNIQQGGQLRRQGAFYGTPDWGTMTVISSAVPYAPPPSPASPHTQEEVTSTAGKSRADVRALVEVEQETDAAVDSLKAAVSNKGDMASDASSSNSCKRCRDPDEQEARKAANRMNISSIVHTAPDAPSKRRRVSRDIVKRPVRRSPRRG
ncbi:hypothetical protein EDD22DRAFT_300060 [Suillus occidentalis]|nr:hypothetical protein EDD22DRAFT_300060 [Suillus occidentalis]